MVNNFYKYAPKLEELSVGKVAMRLAADDDTELSPAQSYLLNYFNDKTGGSRLANRSDLDPSELVSYLPNLVLWDLKTNSNGTIEDIRVRLLGTFLVDFFGEQTGLWLLNKEDRLSLVNIDPEKAMTVKRIANKALKFRQPVLALGVHEFKDKPFSDLRSLYIPFAKDGNDIDMLFGHIELIKTNNAI